MLVDGQAGPCMGWCMGWCMDQGGGDVGGFLTEVLYYLDVGVGG